MAAADAGEEGVGVFGRIASLVSHITDMMDDEVESPSDDDADSVQ